MLYSRLKRPRLFKKCEIVYYKKSMKATHLSIELLLIDSFLAQHVFKLYNRSLLVYPVDFNIKITEL